MSKYSIKSIFLLFILFNSPKVPGQGFICAVGGGSENYKDWSDKPYSWIVEKSDSGKIIILGTGTATNWLPEYFMWLGADTTYNLMISSDSTANLQSTYDEIINARAVFIRGGDQWNYIRYWKGTKTDSAINKVFLSGGVIAGTSAGEAVLGDIDFSARYGSAYPDDALINPFHNAIQFEDDFLNFVPGVLFDSHFIERARHGRLIAMLYNHYYLTGKELLGVGIDDRTALCVNPDGIAEVMGSGAVSVFRIDSQTSFGSYESGKYFIEGLKCDQLTSGWRYDLVNKNIAFIPSSAKFITDREWQIPQRDFWLTGYDQFTTSIQNDLVSYLSNSNCNNVLILTHVGFSSIPLTDFLNSEGISYNILNLSPEILNENNTAELISSSSCFFITGDSLDLISLLNDTLHLSGKAFRDISYNNNTYFFFGRTGKTAGEFYTDNLLADVYAGYRGKMTNNKGLNFFGDLIFEPALYDDNDFYENRMSSVLWGLIRNRKRLGLYLNKNSAVEFLKSDSTVRNRNTNFPVIFINAANSFLVDSSVYRANNSTGTRQVGAINELRYSITNRDDIHYVIKEGKFDNSFSGTRTDGKEISPQGHILFQNYPNPFNPETIIEYHLSDPGFVSLKIFDILGNEICTLLEEFKYPGTYSLNYSPQNLPGSVYFYSLLIKDKQTTKKMVYLK